MNKNLLNINNFNIIQDVDNYYFFRPLNMADNNDIEQGITTDSNGKIQRIRTDRERYKEQSLVPKYAENSQISLEEIFDHIKTHYLKQTNCISLASNANVSMNYGRGSYKDRYIMIKVPKKDFGNNTIFAGQYMLKELSSKIEQALNKLPDESKKETLEIFSKIESANDSQELKSIITKKFTSNIDVLDIDKAHPKKRIIYKAPTARISSYQSLNNKQLLEVNNLYAKLAVLENKYVLSHVIPHASNSKLRETIGSAFSSTEFIHYKDINQSEIIEIPKEAVQQFALIQQMDNINKDTIKYLEKEVLESVRNKAQTPDIFKILYGKNKEFMELKRCNWCNLKNEKYVKYHDEEWGKIIFDEHYLYEMLILESFQAGLSWECVLNKRENFRKAYDNFEIDKVINYDESKIDELMANEGIIRNKLKINASIKNSQIFKEIENEFGSFGSYLKKFTNGKIIYETGKVTSDLSDEISKNLQKRGMKFVGSTIIYSYLQAIGAINSHEKNCFCYCVKKM